MAPQGSPGTRQKFAAWLPSLDGHRPRNSAIQLSVGLGGLPLNFVPEVCPLHVIGLRNPRMFIGTQKKIWPE
jgi:hypothetical protein